MNWSTPSPGSSITALLGPTNTGKTHRCVTRMLAYDSGMLGLPLRLLAREVYDRVAREAGQEQVALVTGEERIMPRRPRYWICTTEAMPTNLDVDFLGVDEIQLAAHPTRGHVFTERLLHARGRYETWFLGAATIRQVIEELVPSAHFQTAQRLSKLNFSGALNLGQIPGRSAIVAFSVPQVYALAERLRVRKGGVAVVLGALSPKTRNAQVDMYQAGEVEHVVATDAIGMGLNMSISHVALAALHKFDGRVQRVLSAAELAQIAGRAGRSIHDGSFGTLEPVWLDPRVGHEIEHHAFPQLRHVMWRNRDLDFSSLDDLLHTLHLPPRHARLRLVNTPTDTAVLENLAQRAEIRSLVRNEELVRLLWNVCQIPDYRQLLPELHAALLSTVFEELVRTGGQLADSWLSRHVSALMQTEGDIDTLVSRIAFVRTWTYVCQRHQWVRNASLWQEKTRALEDELSEALHDRLIARFVSRRRTGVSTPGPPRKATKPSLFSAVAPPLPSTDSQPVDPNHPFASLQRLRVRVAPSEASSAKEIHSDEWNIATNGDIVRGSSLIGKLLKGPTVTQPRVRLVTEASGRDRSTLHEQAQRVVRRHIEQCQIHQPILDACSTSETRGITYQLATGLGAVDLADVQDLVEKIPASERQALERGGVCLGRLTVFLRQSTKARLVVQRYPLVRAHFDETLLPPVDVLGRVSLVRSGNVFAVERRIALLLGYVATRDVWVRCDVAERTVEVLRGENATPQVVASLLGCRKNLAWRVGVELSERAEHERFASSRTASSRGETHGKESFRRQRHSRGVKQRRGSTVSSQK